LDITKEFDHWYFCGVSSEPLIDITIDNDVMKCFPTLARCMNDSNNITTEHDSILCEGFKIFFFIYGVVRSADPCGSNGTKVGLGIGLDGVSDTDVGNVGKARYTAVDGVELNFMLFEEFS